jgi:hypothetical protein
MDIRIVTILIWEGMAYLPTQARFPNNGPFLGVEPIYVVKPELSELLPIVKSIFAKKPNVLPVLRKDEVKKNNDLLPKLTKARSWKHLYQAGINYVIELSEKGYLLEMSGLQNVGHWEMDPSKRILFNPQTELLFVVQAIINDLKTRSK